MPFNKFYKNGILFAFLLLTPISLSSDRITLDFFSDKRRSIAKDFYIWRFLDQNITAKEAEALIGEVYNMSNKLFFKFAEKLDVQGFKEIAECIKAKPKELTKASVDCIALGLTPQKATQLTKEELSLVASKVKEKYPTRAKVYKVLASENPFKELINSEPEVFFKVFNGVKDDYITEHFNKQIDKEDLNKFITFYAFNTTIKKIVLNENLTKLQKSLLDIDSQGLSAEGNFYLALNAIKQNEKEQALKYLLTAFPKAYKTFERDRILFWLYKITDDKKYLIALSESPKINIYSIYAMELLHKKAKNIVTNIKASDKKVDFNFTDPFSWEELKTKAKEANQQELIKMAEKLNTKDTEPYAAYLFEKALKYKKDFFIMPYRKYLQNLTPKRKAMILAIAKQESKFIPTEISRSYALGMMQFMPFVAEDIAKKLGYEDFDIQTLSQPEIAYKFANYHLNYLEKYLYHPLLVFYAYNAGIGFVKRMLLNTTLFQRRGKYEPFLSMELVPNEQARYYGKRVLANYVIYSQLLGKKVMLTPLLKKLTSSKKISYFQKSAN